MFLTSIKQISSGPLYIRATNCFVEIASQPNPVQNREGVKLENQGLIYRFRWDTWAATTIDPQTRTTATPPEQHQQRHDSNECWVRFGGPTKQQDPDDNKRAIILDNFE